MKSMSAKFVLIILTMIFAFGINGLAQSQINTTKFTYKIKIKTGNLTRAGTDAKVFITLWGLGPDGATGTVFSLDTKKKDLEKNSLDSFEVETEKNLGRIERIKVAHNNAGSFGPGWFVDWVEVFGPRSGDKPFGGSDAMTNQTRSYDYYKFSLNRWLAKGEGDNKIEASMNRDGWTPTKDDPVFNAANYYRLTTAWQGDDMSLDVLNDGKNDQLRLAKTDNVSGQMWKIAPAGNGYYRLTTKWQGKDMSLDVLNDGTNDQLRLAKTDNVSGQMWKITPAGKGFYRLTTAWQGEGKSLDVLNDGTNDQLRLAKTDNVSGQMWKITMFPNQDNLVFNTANYYRLTTAWQGEDKSLSVSKDQVRLADTYDRFSQKWKITPAGKGFYRLIPAWQHKSLDVLNDGTNNQLRLTDTGNASGQMWKITPAGKGFYRLTTAWQGEGKSLDVLNDGTNNQLRLTDTGNVSGQMWKITMLPNEFTTPPKRISFASGRSWKTEELTLEPNVTTQFVLQVKDGQLLEVEPSEEGVILKIADFQSEAGTINSETDRISFSTDRAGDLIFQVWNPFNKIVKISLLVKVEDEH